MTRRRRFTEREVITILLDQGATIPCHRCREPIRRAENAEREHLHEIELGGADDTDNCRYSHSHCHAKITNGPPATSAGSSKQRIAKVKRLRGETKQRPKQKIPSRPFQKRRKR
jgi:hypothetical protein